MINRKNTEIPSDFINEKINKANKRGLNRFLFSYYEDMYLCELHKGVCENPIKIDVL